MTAEFDSMSYRRRYRGLIGVKSKMPLRDMPVLSRIYPPERARSAGGSRKPRFLLQPYLPGNTIALISDGSAGNEFGNVGALTVLPKLEAKSVPFKPFANVDAMPLL
ncbi:MAG: hypothetical protein C4567_14970 [Deltaproteobacteria bacterium]|nr:MAG: hypothetical protein C4567_14970 [Deltaproteobacteria bacterium]